jgi:hypothetical protein
MAKLARRQAPATFPDLLDWLESPWTSLLPFTGGRRSGSKITSRTTAI